MDPTAAADGLAAEKERLELKVKNLTQVIEAMAAKAEPPEADGGPPGTAEALASHFDSLKKTISSLEGKIKKSESRGGGEEAKELLAALQKKLDALDTLPALVEAIKKVEEGVKQAASAPPSNLFGGFGSPPPATSKEATILALEVRDSVEQLKADTDARFDAADKQVKKLALALDPATVSRLESAAQRAGDLLDVQVPARVRQEVDGILSALSFSLNAMAQELGRLTAETEKLNAALQAAVERR